MLLAETLRSSTLRLALISILVFGAAVIGLFGYVYFSAASYVRILSDRDIAAEVALLQKAYGEGGRNALIAAIGGKPDFSKLTFTVNHSKFLYGSFVNALLSFLIIAAVIYFVVVLPVNRLMAVTTKTEAATTKDCPECLSTIPIGASRCMYCTAVLVEQTAPPAADVPQQRPGSHRLASE